MSKICILLEQKVNKLKTWRKQVVKSTLNLKPKPIPILKVSMVIPWNKYKSQKKKYMVSWVGTKFYFDDMWKYEVKWSEVKEIKDCTSY